MQVLNLEYEKEELFFPREGLLRIAPDDQLLGEVRREHLIHLILCYTVSVLCFTALGEQLTLFNKQHQFQPILIHQRRFGIKPLLNSGVFPGNRLFIWDYCF